MWIYSSTALCFSGFFPCALEQLFAFGKCLADNVSFRFGLQGVMMGFSVMNKQFFELGFKLCGPVSLSVADCLDSKLCFFGAKLVDFGFQAVEYF